jgi:hypothetical protein
LGSIGRRHLRNLVALGERDVVLYRTHHSTLADEELAAYPVETDIRQPWPTSRTRPSLPTRPPCT